MFGKFILLICIGAVSCVYYNVSFKDLDKCREYDATSGYAYHEYFKIEDVNNSGADGNIVNLKLYIMGPKDAHILLSTEERPSTNDPVYEIVLGGGSNTFSEIRRKRKTQALQSVRRKNLLSALNPIPIAIKIAKNGSIEVGVVGENLPLLNLTDKNPLPIKYISFCSWGTAETKFFYDCQTPDYCGTFWAEKFDDQEFSNPKTLAYDNSEIVLKNISVGFELRQISFKANVGTLSTTGKFNLNWNYMQQLWDPNDYDGLEYTFIRSMYSWKGLSVPSILLMNSKDSNFKGLNTDYKIKINYDGNVSAASADISMNTMCSDISNARNWPLDEVICDIQLGVVSENVTLIPAKENFFKIQGSNYDQSEWHLKDIHSLDNLSSVGITEFNPVQIVYGLHLKRSSLFYYKIFYGPLIVSCAFILLSFWTKHFIRASLNLTGMLILTVMFAISLDYSPRSYVPPILKFYQISIYMSWFAFLLFIVTCWAEKISSKIQPFDWLAKCMQFTWLRLLVGLDIPNNYDHLEKEDFSWESVNLFFNRIVFFIYLIMFLIIMMY